MSRQCLAVCAALLLTIVHSAESSAVRPEHAEKYPDVTLSKDPGNLKNAQCPKPTKDDNIAKEDKSTLLLVNIMFRHGDRAPDTRELDGFRNYEYANETWFPVGYGQLTNGGKKRLYKLGKIMRARYGKFLGDLYTTNLATTFSTDIARTKASALLFNAGLWPPGRYQKWSDEDDLAHIWQPVTYITDSKLNSVFDALQKLPCPLQEFTKVLNREEFQQRLLSHEKLWSYLTEKIGTKIAHPLQIWKVHSLFKSTEAMGKEKPQWVADVWNEIRDITKLTFEAMFFNDNLKKMAIGPALKKILEDCKAKAENVLVPKERKLIVYSGHDATVAPLFAALGGPNGFIDEKGNSLKSIVPSFGSAVILELHRLKTGEHAIKVLYNEDSPDGTFKPLRISGCGEFCPLEKYIELTKGVAVEDQGLDNCKMDKHSQVVLDLLNPSRIPITNIRERWEK